MTNLLSNLQYWTNLTLGRVQPATDSQRRYARIAQASFTALAGKGLALFVSLIAVPLTISYLGVERYGVWVTITTLLTWFHIADLGLGNGLTNAVSRAYGADRPDLAQRYISTVFWVLTAIALFLAILTLFIWSHIDWPTLFNVQSELAKIEIGPAMLIAFLITWSGLPFSIVEKVLGAYQEGAISNYWMALGNVVSLIGLIVVTRSGGGLIWLVFVFSGSLLLVKVVSAVWLFGKQKPWLRPTLRQFDLSSVKHLTTTGLSFFVLQTAGLILFQSDNLVIAHFLGASYVTNYSLIYRLFSYITLIQTLFLNPLWPAYAEAEAKKDWKWISGTLRRTLRLSILFFLPLIILLAVTIQPILTVWTRGIATADKTVVILVALWATITVWANCISVFLNGLGVIRQQLVAAVLLTVLNLGLSVFLVQHIGVVGVILATVVSYSATSLWYTTLVARNLLRKLEVL